MVSDLTRMTLPLVILTVGVVGFVVLKGQREVPARIVSVPVPRPPRAEERGDR